MTGSGRNFLCDRSFRRLTGYWCNRFGCLGILVALLMLPLPRAEAVISDLRVTDVTTRSFSVVWVNDEAVTNARLRVFSDAAGQTDITATLQITPVSAALPGAHSQGIVKIQATGLLPGTDYFVETETTGFSGVEIFPLPPAPFIHLKTALQTVKATSANGPITNDLIHGQINHPDGVNPTQDTLLMVEVPSLSPYPLSAFVGNGVAAPSAIVDLNNSFDQMTGLSAAVPAKTVLKVTQYRGLLCPIAAQKLLRLRRAPIHEEGLPTISEFENAAPCFSPNGTAADFNCDGAIGPGDFNLLLAQFGLASNQTTPDCRFNPDYDLSGDGAVGPGDFNLFLSVFGSIEP